MRIGTKKTIIYALRILLTALCIATIGYIFSNSLQTGVESAQKSDKVVQTVQKVVSYVAPQSPIATATGEAYDKLHEIIRKMAHFSEFAILGTVLIWCYFSYTTRKKYLYIPLLIMCIVPIMDECLQLFSAGRGTEFADVLLDCLGCAVGGLAAMLALGIALWIVAIVRKNSKKDVTVSCCVYYINERNEGEEKE